MADVKTQRTSASVATFIAAIPDETRRADARVLSKLLHKISGEKPAMWGGAIVGFGQRTLTYPNGRTLDWMVVAFSPRKANTVIYGNDFDDKELLAKLGKHKISKACLYITRLSDVDMVVLEKLLRKNVQRAKKS